jgi:hypothetical protein
MRPNLEKPGSRLVLLLGLACLVLALAALYSFGSTELWSRFTGLALMIAAGAAAWLGERIRSRSATLQTQPSRAHYLFIAFLLFGVIGFVMPPEPRWRVIWFLFVFCRRALQAIH